MRFFCTLFDSHYLSRGLAMYESLRKHASDFHLYVLAMDEKSERILRALSCENMTVISLQEFEDEELKKVKQTRTHGEYCWTCTPSLIKYCIEQYHLDMCTYLDADIYFYADPEPLLEEMGEASVMISPHRYTPVYDQSMTSGIYCVQFVTFRRDARGMEALEWWRNSCNSWCYARFEDGKFGDQKYLDDWPQRFEGVHVMEHLGGGVAPWNVQQYHLLKTEGERYVLQDKKTKRVFSLLFYHYHNLRFLAYEKVDIGTYLLPRWAKKKLYASYILHLESMGQKAQAIEDGDYHGTRSLRKGLKRTLLSFLGRLNFLRGVFFVVLNVLLERFYTKSGRKVPLFLNFLVRLLTMYHNVYPLRYFKE